MNSTDRIFYIMGLVLLGGLVMVEILAAAGVLTLTDLGFSCSFFCLSPVCTAPAVAAPTLSVLWQADTCGRVSAIILLFPTPVFYFLFLLSGTVCVR